ncbi:MAG: hypothetical protein NT045_02605 [Candidatus Aureabacteria bacterium]|nr:hypothetical protein [Candidatus Auribacterota bacterium]
MLRGTTVVCAVFILAMLIGVAGAQEQKDGGMLGKVKSIIPGTGEKAPAVSEGAAVADTADGVVPAAGEQGAVAEKQAPGMMDKMKGMMPGAGEKSTCGSKGGMMDKMKGIMPGSGSKSSGAGSCGMMDKMKGMIPGGKK